jgi:adenine-specific DNA-methyltransferase
MNGAMKTFSRWAEQLGLATMPLFGERDAISASAEHHVMLDGGRGSFALTEITDLAELEHEATKPNRSWIWSANLPHHVVLAGDTALVSRWDSPEATPLRAAQVEDRLEDFYRFLLQDRIKTSQTVVEHAVTLFRRLRGLLDLKGIRRQRQ